MTKRKSLIAVLSFAMVLSITLIFGITLSGGTLTAMAASAPLSVTVNGKALYSGYYLESNDSTTYSTGATTEPATYVAWYDGVTLTLKGYNGGQISFGGALAVDLTIKLKGENTISSSTEGISGTQCENLVIAADEAATLNINVSSTESRVFGISAGFGATATNGSVTIKGKAAVNIDCNTTSFRGSYGIYAQNTFSIEGSANLSIKCKFSHENNDTSYCIVSGQNKPVFNTEGVVTLDISESVKRNYCISANSGIDMEKGTLICRYKPGSIYSYACSQTIETAPEGCVLRENPYYLGETVIKSGVGRTVTVENGLDYYDKNSNQYVVGETVRVKTTIADLPFKGWEGAGIIFANAAQKETSFVMGDEDVTVKAVYDVFIKQPIFTRTGNTTGSVSLQVAKQPYGGYYPIIFLKESGKSINRTFNKDALSDDYTYNYSEVSSFDFPVGTYRIQVEYGGNYFVSEPFEIDYTEKEPDKFTVNVTDGIAKVGDSTISSAKKGETVTITATDKKGFVFKAWKVVSGGVALANANSVTTTFEMPESNVEIKATYKQLISFVEATVTEPVDGETIDTTAVPGNELYKVLQVKWRDVAAANDLNGYSKFVKDKQYTVSVKFQVTSHSDYAFDRENVKAKINGRSAAIESVSEGFVTIKYTFTATAAPLPKYTLTIENGTLEGGATTGTFAEGSSVTVTANIPASDMMFDKWTVSGVTLSSEQLASKTVTFTMGTSDVTITATCKPIPKYTVTVVDGKLTDGATTGSFKAGESITITADTKDGYTFDKWTATGITLTNEQRSSATITITVGTNDVTLTATYEEVIAPDPKYKVTIENGTNSGGEEIEAGQTVTITAGEAPEGKEFDKWVVVSGSVMLEDEHDVTTTFVMPESDVEIKATYKDKTPGGGETPGTDDPSGGSIEEPTENKGLSGGAIAGIAVGSVAVVGVGGFAIFWFLVKKKTFAELIAAIKSGFGKK